MADDAFRIGVAPHTSARVIAAQYQPVRAAVQEAVGTRTDIVTAPDFNVFIREAAARKYDLVITTGHQAALLRQDAGYLPLVTYQADFTAKAVVKMTSLA